VRSLALLAIAPLAACGASHGERDTITIGLAADLTALDPARVSEVEPSEVCEQIFEHLVRYRSGTNDVEPALATHWTVDEQGKTWTFFLRRGVRFHDGTPLDADAVVFSFERQRDPQHPYHEPDFLYWVKSYRNILRVEKVDDYTIRILIDRPNAPFLASLAMTAVSIVSPQAVRRFGHEFARHPVGTGPFRFVEWVPGDRATLEANPEYWDRGPPRVGRLIYRVIGGEAERLVAIESGAIDVAYQIAKQDLGYVRLHPDLQLARIAANNVAFLAMNLLHPPFDDVRVRHAVNHAVNKRLIVKLLYQSMAIPANGALPPTMWGYDPDLPTYEYDPERAQALLREAGWDGSGRRPRLYVMSGPRPYIPQPEQVARVIARNLHDVGMDVDLVVQPWEKHLESTDRGDHDLCIRGWIGDNGDPDNFLYTLLDRDASLRKTGSNVAFYRNAEVHGLLVWARETSDQNERVALYRKAQYIIAQEAPWVPLAHAELAVVARADVRGLQIDPTAIVHYRRVVRVP
jgi:peptide/nickel transport system substrate-binding protein